MGRPLKGKGVVSQAEHLWSWEISKLEIRKRFFPQAQDESVVVTVVTRRFGCHGDG